MSEIPKDVLEPPRQSPIGLAAVERALSDWEELEKVVDEIYDGRKTAKERAVPDLE